MEHFTTDHHAFLVSLNGRLSGHEVMSKIEAELRAKFNKRKLVVQRYSGESLQVALARDIRSAQLTKNSPDEKRVVFLSFTQITSEAQNTFLKLLEEPPSNTYFFLITPNGSMLLDTVRSRCIDLSLFTEEENVAAKNFLSLSIKERLEKSKELLEDKQQINSFFYDLEREIDSLTDKSKYAKHDLRKILFESKKGIETQSSVSKYFLERLALTLPILPN